MATSRLITIDLKSWDAPISSYDQSQAVEALEHGGVLLLPALSFDLSPDEQRFLAPHWSSGSTKNISYDPEADRVRGTTADGRDRDSLKALMRRYAAASRRLVAALLPDYLPKLEQARTSFRPVEVADRISSWRQDDRRLHTDAYPSRPTRGARILRVFSNVNASVARVWRVGEPFESVVATFLPALHRPRRGASTLLAALRLTKGRRAPYDHVMLQLHDSVKQDLAYQERAPQTVVSFPPGSSWIVFTDQVLHAVMAGQHALEQTFYLPVSAQRWPDTAPINVLTRLAGRAMGDGA